MKMQSSGDRRRENAKLYPPSLRAKRSNPSLRLPRYGLLRCARNDGERDGLARSTHPRSPRSEPSRRARSRAGPISEGMEPGPPGPVTARPALISGSRIPLW